HPLALVEAGLRVDLHPQMRPVDRLRAGGSLQLRGQCGAWARGGEDPHRGSDGTEEILQRLRQLTRAPGLLRRRDAGKRQLLPVRRRGLIAGMEVADVAE